MVAPPRRDSRAAGRGAALGGVRARPGAVSFPGSRRCGRAQRESPRAATRGLRRRWESRSLRPPAAASASRSRAGRGRRWPAGPASRAQGLRQRAAAPVARRPVGAPLLPCTIPAVPPTAQPLLRSGKATPEKPPVAVCAVQVAPNPFCLGHFGALASAVFLALRASASIPNSARTRSVLCAA